MQYYCNSPTLKVTLHIWYLFWSGYWILESIKKRDSVQKTYE